MEAVLKIGTRSERVQVPDDRLQGILMLVGYTAYIVVLVTKFGVA